MYRMNVRYDVVVVLSVMWCDVRLRVKSASDKSAFGDRVVKGEKVSKCE